MPSGQGFNSFSEIQSGRDDVFLKANPEDIFALVPSTESSKALSVFVNIFFGLLWVY